MIARQAANSLQRFSSLGRQMQRVGSSVGWVRTPLQHSAFFQLVDQDDQPARQDPQVACQFLLADPTGAADKPQDSRVRRREVHGSESLREL